MASKTAMDRLKRHSCLTDALTGLFAAWLAGSGCRAEAANVLNCEAFLQDDLGMTAAGPSGDPGPPSQFAFGVMAAQTALDILDAGHGRVRDRATFRYQAGKGISP